MNRTSDETPIGRKFDQGAAMVGEMRLSIFRKRPDPKRKPTALRINYSQKHFFFAKAKISCSMGIKTDHMTQTKLNEENKIAGIQLQNEQLCSRGQAFSNQSKQNDEEGSQSLSEKSGRKSCGSNSMVNKSFFPPISCYPIPL